jgi:hypothetical protein
MIVPPLAGTEGFGRDGFELEVDGFEPPPNSFFQRPMPNLSGENSR